MFNFWGGRILSGAFRHCGSAAARTKTMKPIAVTVASTRVLRAKW
jgi:hypothetical protein